jgi:hypothetical protein
MKCTNPSPCTGEMKPLKASDTNADVFECVKCGWRVAADVPKNAVVKAPAPILPIENKGE